MYIVVNIEKLICVGAFQFYLDDADRVAIRVLNGHAQNCFVDEIRIFVD